MKNNHYYLILFFFFGGLLSIKAQDTLFYSQDQSVIDIGRFARFHIDANDRLSLAQVQALPDGAFEKSKTEVMNFGNTTASIGIKLYIKNQTNEPLYIMCLLGSFFCLARSSLCCVLSVGFLITS